MIEVHCLGCKRLFKTYQSRIADGRGKFCSKACFYKDFSTRSPWNKGKKLSKSHRLKAIKNLIHASGEKHPRWKRVKKICKQCKKEFCFERWREKEKKRGQFCSRKCNTDFNSDDNHWANGKKRPEISKENHYLWKGKDASYQAKHSWIIRHFGQPDTCEHCKKSGLKGKFINWANISGKYLRKRKDWLRLCVRCHFKYDNRSAKIWLTRRKNESKNTSYC